MGTWGPGIFSDDLAADIRDDYRSFLEDQVEDGEAMRLVVQEYGGPDGEEHVLWLALAAAQSRLGRLDEEVKARALEVLAAGGGLIGWENARPKSVQQRRAALAALQAQLTGPQPPRRTLRPVWREQTDLRPGQVLGFDHPQGPTALLRVLRLDSVRTQSWPVLELLAQPGQSAASVEDLADLPGALEGTPPKQLRWSVIRCSKRQPDWSAVGFRLVADCSPRSRDNRGWAGFTTDWEYLASELATRLAAQP